MSSNRTNGTGLPDADPLLRMYLAAHGGGRKGDLIAQANDSNARVSEADLTAAAAEAVKGAENHPSDIEAGEPFDVSLRRSTLLRTWLNWRRPTQRRSMRST